jgi:hypothetical protein
MACTAIAKRNDIPKLMRGHSIAECSRIPLESRGQSIPHHRAQLSRFASQQNGSANGRLGSGPTKLIVSITSPLLGGKRQRLLEIDNADHVESGGLPSTVISQGAPMSQLSLLLRAMTGSSLSSLRRPASSPLCSPCGRRATNDRLLCGLQSGRTSAPTRPQWSGHARAQRPTGVSSGRWSAFIATLWLHSIERQ